MTLVQFCDFDNAGKCRNCEFVVKLLPNHRNCPAFGFSHLDVAVHDLPPGSPSVLPPEQTISREAPGFLEKVRNFASAAVDHVAAGMPMASDEEILRRHDICLACEHLQDNACTQCGCPVSRVRGYMSKLSWADQECPLGKWRKAADA
jgi:hypothetical protein